MTEHKTLVEALLAFQASPPKLAKTATNPHFHNKFVPLDGLMNQTLPVLAEHGLTWMTFPSQTEDGRPTLGYRLQHVSGESVDGTMPLSIGDRVTPQAQGSAITYARRYAMMAVLGLVGDDDDDGNAASRPAARATQANGNGSQPPTLAQLDELKTAARGLSGRDIKTALTVRGIAHGPSAVSMFINVPADQVQDLCDELMAVER